MMLSRSIFFLISLWLVIETVANPEPIPCPSSLKKAKCNRIFVPLDHSKPHTSARIPVLYAVLSPSKPTTSDSAIVIIPGGPGLSGLDAEISLDPAVVDAINQPFILLDPRGTGNASRLNCDLLRLLNSTETRAPVSNAERLIGIKSCLTGIGREVVHYSTNAIIDDMEIIRKAAGFKQLTLYGISYGAFIAQAYAQRHPKSVKSLILDSPLPLRLDLYRPTRLTGAKRVYKEKNANNKKFNLNSFLDHTATVLKRLRSSSDLQRELLMIPRDLFDLFATQNDDFPVAIRDAAVAKDYTKLKQMQQKQITPIPGFSIAALIATRCNDEMNRVPWALDASLEERFVSLAEDATVKVSAKEVLPFSVLESLPVIRFCPGFPFPQLRSEGVPLNLPLQRDIPALTLIGTLDELTPIEDIPLLDPVLRSNTVVVKGAKHVISGGSNPCADNLIFEFLTTGKVSNVNACA